MTAPARRRVRLNRTNKHKHVASKELTELIELAWKQQQAMERAGVKAAEAMKKIQEIMTTNDLAKFVSDTAVAEMITPRSNAVTTINPKQFREAVTDDDEFFSSIKVGITDAKKVLPQKTIDKISSKSTPKKKDPVPKVRKRTKDD